MKSAVGMMYPKSSALKLDFVKGTGTAEYQGFDELQVHAALGDVRFNSLMSGVKSVFCCGHRTYEPVNPTNKPAGYEVHCIYAADLEAFLQAGG